MFKGLSNFASLMKNAQQIGGKAEEIRQRLRSERVTGTAGAGLIEVEANGLGEILRMRIDPQLIQSQDQDMIESLAPAAINQALEKSKQLHAQALQSMLGDMELPGLDKALAQFMGSPDAQT